MAANDRGAVDSANGREVSGIGDHTIYRDPVLGLANAVQRIGVAERHCRQLEKIADLERRR